MSNLNELKLIFFFLIFLAILATAITVKNPDIALGVGLAGAITMFSMHIVRGDR